MIGQSTWSRYNNVRLLGKFQCLGHHICQKQQTSLSVQLQAWLMSVKIIDSKEKDVLTHSTNNDAVPQTQGLPQDSKLLSNLIGQLPA